MRAASVTRLYVKAFTQDGSSKALMVEESMTCGRVLALLADKNHVQLSQKWTLVEHLPHLHMGKYTNICVQQIIGKDCDKVYALFTSTYKNLDSL